MSKPIGRADQQQQREFEMIPGAAQLLIQKTLKDSYATPKTLRLLSVQALTEHDSAMILRH